MARYSYLKENDIRWIAREYDLAMIDFELIDGGAGNTNYTLRTRQGKYVLTVFEISLARVVKIGQILLLLAEHGFPTTRLLTPTKDSLTTMYKDKPVLLKQYIAGQVYKDLNENMLSQIGTALARLHQLPAPGFLHDKHAYGLQAFPNVIGLNINQEYEAWLAKRLTYLEQRIPPGLPRGLIHGDIFYDNVLFNGEKLKAIIDFEETCRYYHVFDLGMGILGLCIDGSRLALDKARSLVSGYQQTRRLEVREKEALQLFAEYAAIATSYWRFWMYNIHTPIAENANIHWQMVRIAEEIAAIPDRKFLQAVFK